MVIEAESGIVTLDSSKLRLIFGEDDLIDLPVYCPSPIPTVEFPSKPTSITVNVLLPPLCRSITTPSLSYDNIDFTKSDLSHD